MKAKDLNNTVWATLAPSPVSGIGVFAIRDIPELTEFTSYTKNVFVMTPEDFKEILPEIQSIILDRTLFSADQPLYFIHPNAQAVLIAFMNHAEKPNTNGLLTLRDIHKGEELTENYKHITAHYMEGLHELTAKHHKGHI